LSQALSTVDCWTWKHSVIRRPSFGPQGISFSRRGDYSSGHRNNSLCAIYPVSGTIAIRLFFQSVENEAIGIVNNNNNMACDGVIGKRFHSYDDLQERIGKYQTENFVQYYVSDSRTIAAAQKLLPKQQIKRNQKL